MPDSDKLNVKQSLVLGLLKNSDYSITQIATISQMSRSSIYRIADRFLGESFIEQRTQQLAVQEIKKGLVQNNAPPSPADDNDAVQVIDIPEHSSAAPATPLLSSPSCNRNETSAEDVTAEANAEHVTLQDSASKSVLALTQAPSHKSLLAMHPIMQNYPCRQVVRAMYGKSGHKYAQIVRFIESYAKERGCLPTRAKALSYLCNNGDGTGISYETLCAIFHLLEHGFKLDQNDHFIIPDPNQIPPSLPAAQIKPRPKEATPKNKSTEPELIRIKYGSLEISWCEPDRAKRLSGIMQILQELNIKNRLDGEGCHD